MLLENGMEMEEKTIDSSCFFEEYVLRPFQIPHIGECSNFLRFPLLLLSLPLAIDLFSGSFSQRNGFLFVCG